MNNIKNAMDYDMLESSLCDISDNLDFVQEGIDALYVLESAVREASAPRCNLVGALSFTARALQCIVWETQDCVKQHIE